MRQHHIYLELRVGVTKLPSTTVILVKSIHFQEEVINNSLRQSYRIAGFLKSIIDQEKRMIWFDLIWLQRQRNTSDTSITYKSTDIIYSTTFYFDRLDQWINHIPEFIPINLTKKRWVSHLIEFKICNSKSSCLPRNMVMVNYTVVFFIVFFSSYYTLQVSILSSGELTYDQIGILPMALRKNGRWKT